MMEHTAISGNEEVRRTSAVVRKRRAQLLRRVLWWSFFLTSAVFGAYALRMGGLELAAQLGWAPNAPARAAPLAFVIHALAGGVALIIGPLQFSRRLRARKRRLHRWLGRVYVGSIWLASLTGLWSAILFDRGVAARLAFVLVAALWFGTTTVAYWRAGNGRFGTHREWMVRSFALSFFFVTFPLWTEGLARTSLPAAVSYPVGVFLGWAINLALVEWWIRRGRPQQRAVAASGQAG